MLYIVGSIGYLWLSDAWCYASSWNRGSVDYCCYSDAQSRQSKAFTIGPLCYSADYLTLTKKMDEYKDIIIEMLGREFQPTGTTEPEYKSTAVVLRMVQGIIPAQPIDEHDIFSVMKEMGFNYHLHTIYAVDENGYETEKIRGQVFLWEMYSRS